MKEFAKHCDIPDDIPGEGDNTESFDEANLEKNSPPQEIFEAYVRGNLLIPQVPLGFVTHAAEEAINSSEPYSDLLSTKLSKKQFENLLSTMHNAHAAYGVGVAEEKEAPKVFKKIESRFAGSDPGTGGIHPMERMRVKLDELWEASTKGTVDLTFNLIKTLNDNGGVDGFFDTKENEESNGPEEDESCEKAAIIDYVLSRDIDGEVRGKIKTITAAIVGVLQDKSNKLLLDEYRKLQALNGGKTHDMSAPGIKSIEEREIEREKREKSDGLLRNIKSRMIEGVTSKLPELEGNIKEDIFDFY